MAQIMKSVVVVLGLSVGLFSGGALVAQTTAPQAPVATDVANNVFFAEKAKWGILRMHLTDKLSVSQTVVNQVGAVINNHAALCAFATAVAGSLAMFALTGSDESVRRSSPESGFSPSSASCSNNKRGACSTFLTFAILEALTYGLCTVCGARWEDKSAQSLIALTDFVQGWNVYKEYTPVILHPLFQGYANDLKRHAQLTIIDGDGARKLIEALLATAVVVEAAK
ncbi:MAG: hypothetical protein WCW33_00665 [Candidatus Babeliales bacterium]|jgi:hypothetical protein